MRHGRDSAWHRAAAAPAVRRAAAARVLDHRRPGRRRCAQERGARSSDGARITLERDATVISYGAQADGIVTTARRSPDAAASDQVLVAFLKEDYSLERALDWDTLGMRGTCSAGFKLKATGDGEQILPEPYEKIHAQTMMPVAHLTWSGVWAGIAAGAVERARAVRAQRRAQGRRPAAAGRRASHARQRVAAHAAGARRRRRCSGSRPHRPTTRALEALDFQTAMNLLKVNASELAIATVMSALQACGLSGYRNDSEFSIGRHLRDVLSSPIMINNDRILANVGDARRC